MGNRSFQVILGMMLVALSSTSCRDLGLQGSSRLPAFQGIKSIETISPYTLELSWELHPNILEYSVYKEGSSVPVARASFASVRIGSLNPLSTYSFAVSGLDRIEEKEYGFNTYMSGRTYDQFRPITAQNLSFLDDGKVRVQWTKQGNNVKYLIFYKEKNESWNFLSANKIVQALDYAILDGFQSTKEYCFWMQAEYLDGVREPSVASIAQVDLLAPCGRPQEVLANAPEIHTTRVGFNGFLWFWRESGDPTYRINIFQKDTDLPLAESSDSRFRSIQH